MRLIDLHTDWPLQYAAESTTYGPAPYADVTSRSGQAEGYLGATSAAVVSCYRRADDWAGRHDPWLVLADLIARIEAEFAGRLLRDPADLPPWRDEPDALAWALIGVEGFDYLIRSESDLDRLPDLWRRGVRLFQPTYSPTSLLAGSSVPGDDRGLLDLGRLFLDRLASLADASRPILDLAHLNPLAMAAVLDWLEAHPDRLLVAYSHGALVRDGFAPPRAITRDNLARLRSLGGTIGLGVSPPFYTDPDQVRLDIETAASLPFLGHAGYDGIAIGTDFLGVSSTLPALGNAEAVVAWIGRTFPPDVAERIASGNARSLIERAVGPP